MKKTILILGAGLEQAIAIKEAKKLGFGGRAWFLFRTNCSRFGDI